jgi:exonuclease SbcD
MAPIKIIHTSDWHLGKKLYKWDRFPEHEFFLNWLSHEIKTQAIDILIIAGDIFDVPNPPHQSLEMFFNFLHFVTENSELEIFIIGGNHDSAQLLNAPRDILKNRNIHIWGGLHHDYKKHHYQYTKNDNQLQVVALPYFRSHEIEQWMNRFNIKTENDENSILKTLESFLNQITDQHAKHRIFIGHHQFGFYSESGSEHSLSLSGVNSIPIKLFNRFDYMALGHIHKKQILNQNQPIAIYSGSPIAFRFSETTQKVISVITLDGNTTNYELVNVPQLYEIASLETEQSRIKVDLEKLKQAVTKKTLVEIKVKIDVPEAGLIDQIKDLTRNELLEVISIKPYFTELSINKKQNLNELFEMSVEQLFKQYCLEKFSIDSVPENLLLELNKLIEQEKICDSNN